MPRPSLQAEFQDICKEYGVEQFLGALDQCAVAHAVGNAAARTRCGQANVFERAASRWGCPRLIMRRRAWRPGSSASMHES